MIPPLETQHGHGNQDLELLSQNIKRFVKVLEDNPMLDGHLLENISLTAGNNTINHKLGRRLRGWTVVRSWNPAPLTYPNPYVPGAPIPYAPFMYETGATDKILSLYAASDCQVSLWVF